MFYARCQNEFPLSRTALNGEQAKSRVFARQLSESQLSRVRGVIQVLGVTEVLRSGACSAGHRALHGAGIVAETAFLLQAACQADSLGGTQRRGQQSQPGGKASRLRVLHFDLQSVSG